MDQTPTAVGDLEAVEAWADTICGTADTGEWARTSPLKRQAVPTVRGSWPTAQLLLSRCPTLTSLRSGSRL
jgi:hypothetical protein